VKCLIFATDYIIGVIEWFDYFFSMIR
jgi:hypothetical protein